MNENKSWISKEHNKWKNKCGWTPYGVLNLCILALYVALICIIELIIITKITGYHPSTEGMVFGILLVMIILSSAASQRED